jgi:hypothetical protein
MMPERPQDPSTGDPSRPDDPLGDDPDRRRERSESTDLGYRDTEEERAYEEAAEGGGGGDAEPGEVGGG